MNGTLINGLTLVNLTPHTLNIQVQGITYTLPPSGTVARVASQQTQVGTVAGTIPVYSTTYGAVTGVPPAAPNTIYVVSAMVLSALGGSNPSVYAPNTGASAIRNAQGQIVAVTSLVQ